MKYTINPPYTFYTKLVSQRRLEKGTLLGTAPYKTHARDVEVFFLEVKGVYEIYVVSSEIEKIGLIPTRKRYVHKAETFSDLQEAAHVFSKYTGEDYSIILDAQDSASVL